MSTPFPGADPNTASVEAERLRTLRNLRVLDTQAEQVFDDLTEVAALVCRVPISLVTLVDADRLWLKANHGLPGVSETPRDIAFCDHTIRTEGVLEIRDMTRDPRFADNPLVTGSPDIRFYAGAPLRLSNGAQVGALCVIDRTPRELEPWQLEAMSKLSSTVSKAMEYRRSALEFVDSEARFRALSEAFPLGVFSTDPEGRCTYVNRVWEAIMGLGGAEATGHGWHRNLHADDRESVIEEWRRAASERLDFDKGFRVVRGDRSVAHVRAISRPIYSDQGELNGYVGSIDDVTEQVSQRQELERAHEHISRDVKALRTLSDELDEQRELLEVTLHSITDAVITTDATGAVTWLNPVAERLTGHDTADSLGRPLAEIFRAVDARSGGIELDPVAACLGGGESVAGTGHAILVSRADERLDIEHSAAPICKRDAHPLGVVLVFRDVSEQRRVAAEMKHRATHDALTGLINRSEFEARLECVLTDALDGPSDGALVYVDLDHFKIVNDSCGHAIGDRLLEEVAGLIGGSVRAGDTVARIGGDEFALILPRCDLDHAHEVGRQICERVGDFPFVHDGRRFRVGTSIGIAPIDGRWQGTAAIMQAADLACYGAKQSGRNRVVVWADTDHGLQSRSRQTRWVTRLEEALDDDAFELHAQRIESLSERSGPPRVEVLLRLRGEGGELFPPGAFLPAAERFHLASRIDRWVLRRTIALLTDTRRPRRPRGPVGPVGAVRQPLRPIGRGPCLPPRRARDALGRRGRDLSTALPGNRRDRRRERRGGCHGLREGGSSTGPEGRAGRLRCRRLVVRLSEDLARRRAQDRRAVHPGHGGRTPRRGRRTRFRARGAGDGRAHRRRVGRSTGDPGAGTRAGHRLRAGLLAAPPGAVDPGAGQSRFRRGSRTAAQGILRCRRAASTASSRTD